MKYSLIIMFFFSLFLTPMLNAEKKQFEYTATYTMNEFDTPESARFMVMDLADSYYKIEIEKFLTKQNGIKIFNYSSSDMQNLISNYYTIRVMSENLTPSSITNKTSVVIDTDLYVSFFSKIKNHPDTFRYFKELINTNETIVSKIVTSVKKYNAKNADTDSMVNARNEYTNLISSLQANKLLLRAKCLFMAQDEVSFIQFVDTTYKNKTPPSWVLYASALIYAKNKNFEKATLTLTELNKYTPTDSLIPYYSTIIEAKINSNHQSESKVLALYDSALKLQPKSAETYLHRAQFYTYIGKPQPALKDYDAFLKTSPMSADTLYQYGLILNSLLKDKEAKESMTKAARYGNDQAVLWLNQNRSSEKRTAPVER